jgi:hypothetical protein
MSTVSDSAQTATLLDLKRGVYGLYIKMVYVAAGNVVRV